MIQHKIAIICLLFCQAFVTQAQLLKSGADTQAVTSIIPFPQASATMIVSFNASMMDLSKVPNNGPSKRASLEELQKRYEKDKKDIPLMMDLYYAYFDKGEPRAGLPYLQKAYDRAMELYEQNPSNMELLEQMTEMLILVNRIPDVPAVWKDYTDRNPEVAKGWAKLAMYQIQILDTTGCRLSLEKAFALDPEQPEIYVAALLEVMYKLLLKMQTSEAPNLEADNSFFEKALAQHPNSRMARLGYDMARLLELFYSVLLNNVERFGGDKSFKMEMDERQKTETAELEKAFKTMLQDQKVVNKFLPLKALLVLDVLRGEMDMATAYLEESKKYIPNDVDLYKMLAFGYLPLKQYHKAIPHLKKAVELNPNFNDNFALARLYFENHQYDESIAALELLLQTSPDKIDVPLGLIAVQMREGKFKDACSSLFRLESLYQDEIDLNKDAYFPFYKAICILVFSKNKDESAKALQYVVDNNLPWAEEAKLLLKRFF